MKEYKTVRHATSYTMTERKSEFICYVTPVSDESTALAFIGDIKKKHSDAKHNVYVYILRSNNTTRFSDDGEPHGTAALPVLELLHKEEITDVAVVITRYFGGILLGTGGLVRAYTAVVKAALEIAGIVRNVCCTVFTVSLTYSDYPKIEYFLQGKPIIRDKTTFENEAVMVLAVAEEGFCETEKSITEITCGRAVITKLGERFYAL
ncbi:MAG: YigZ family protein [Firmicutes bacterium HGW-Firmicutes-21]|nr:MAG: YigZ family protein [Firmicutes bacterium HGW-Firmicutes-21]